MGLSAAGKKAVQDTGMCYYHWAFADEENSVRSRVTHREN
jgi:hypothetical protein